MGRVTNDPEKLIEDLTTLIFDRFEREVDFSQVDPFTRKHLRQEIRDLLEQHADIGGEAFDDAFQTGYEQGKEETRRDMKEDLRDMFRNFIEDL